MRISGDFGVNSYLSIIRSYISFISDQYYDLMQVLVVRNIHLYEEAVKSNTTKSIP